MAAPRDDEGWRKEITSLLMRGSSLVVIDNVVGRLYAPSLAAAITARTWEDRLLGRSAMVSVPQRAVWVATGNNIQLGGDLPRRCYWIRLDAHRARPWQRHPATFRHPQLSPWVRAERGRILAAILTLARAWVVADRPSPAHPPRLGGFEEWANVVGGLLTIPPVDGFLGNLDALYEQADCERPQWEAFFQRW